MKASTWFSTPSPTAMWRTCSRDECFRVLRPGGRLLAGMDNGLNFLFDDVGTLPLTVSNPLPFNPLRGSRAELERMVAQGEGVSFPTAWRSSWAAS